MVEIPIIEIIYTSMLQNTGVQTNQHDYEKLNNNPGYFEKGAITLIAELQPVDEETDLSGFGDIFAPYGSPSLQSGLPLLLCSKNGDKTKA